MSPPNLNFWSISSKESPETQQKHALRNRFLRTLLSSNDIFNAGYNRKTLIRKRTSILVRVFFNYEQLFQYDAPLVENAIVAQDVNAFSKKLFVSSQLYIHFSILEIRVVSIALHDNIHLLCISMKVDAYFSLTIVNCPF